MALQKLGRNYFIASILVHVAVVVSIMYIANRNATINKNFVVFGAHSRYTTKALYKSSSVPFVAGKAGKKGSGKKKGKNTGKKKSAVAKKVIKHVVTKKTKARAKPGLAPKNSLRKMAAQLAMPSPTSMIEDHVKASSSSKKKLKKKLVKAEQVLPLDDPHDQEKEQEAVQEPASIQQDAVVNAAAAALAPTEDQNQENEDDGGGDDEIHVGIIDSSDPITRRHQRIMSEEFNRLWQPPVGVRKGTECQVRITFSKEGAITNIAFVKHSQVPIYDLSILRLKLATPNIPQMFHGTSQKLTFHQ